MKIFNTFSRKKETFTPLNKGHVGMYVCGPTVYDVGHLGHARAAVSFDIIRRYFLYKGFSVTFVSNITDVDDKIIKRAAEEKTMEKELAERIIPEYAKDYGALGVMPPDHQPRATEYITKMVLLVEKLMKKGVAYATDEGVYFDVSSFKDYGKLSKKKIDELQAGARIAVDEKKRNPQDFAVWKKEKPGEPAWKGPGGMSGRPGWHIECSAMSMDLLGETFDIHGGGIDLVFPHHEDEIAQSESATGKPFSRYWLHNGHIQVNKEKMSKSLGNFFTIKEILAKYHPLVVRYFLISTHYRMPIDFSDDLLEQARNSLSRLKDFMRRLKNIVIASEARPGLGEAKQSQNVTLSLSKRVQKTNKNFEKAMDDDFEISKALAAIFDFVNDANRLLDSGKFNKADVQEIKAVMEKFDSVLGVLQFDEALSSEIERLIAERNEVRKNKDFKRSDEIRLELEKKGIALEDTPSGTLWKKIL